ncbi:hypothetical protein M406DRAFT_246205 [Cryphonectria parasitica EP155]|uniref:Riboflavin kinase n=1 Tax=Cryphonectria parasitica (strain ATCC 38755 / EP155) TaxID=660469 RepID=A0A9P4YAK3_CRYP1|nr:uncharacterized protein M406DRAFT_246205 [Cryphonectria parasitica EP155]KAF3769469.1 hypothetical protein M406DRAFT_246205 [Cryphonectria parasitica EP155]
MHQDNTPVQARDVNTSTNDGLELPSSTTTNTAEKASPDESVDGTHKPSLLKHVFDETRFFVGGLIPRPHESTKHYTILRHSSSVVFYRGPTTSVVITVFSSSQPSVLLPATRTIWLQQRGVSGNTGMKLKRLVGATGSWLDVTPTTQVAAEDLGASERRSWQRDIDKFMKTAAREKTGHVPRETHVIRLPVVAGDGYFRLVLCAGGTTASCQEDDADTRKRFTKRRVLCSSPIFRIASTSTDPSVFRGASLKTLPLELGVMAGSIVGNAKVAGLLAPVTNTVQQQIQRVQPDFVVREAATTAYQASGLQEKIEVVDDDDDPYSYSREPGYDNKNDDVLERLDEGAEVDMDVIGPDSGPQSPFPIQFTGKMTWGAEQETKSIPAAALQGVPDSTILRLKGSSSYMGWASILPHRDLDKGISLDWHEVVLEVSPSPHAPPSVAARNAVTVNWAHDPGLTTTSFSAKIKVMIMDFIRPLDTRASRDEIERSAARDIQITLSSLSRSNWGPELTIERVKTSQSARSFSEKYTDARKQIQQRTNSVPLHWAGIRSSGAALRDRALGNGGYWVAR